MKPVWKQLQTRRAEVVGHPFFSWFNSESVPLDQRFVFAPLMIDFIMGFADMNKWFLSYPDPQDDRERTINEHAAEDSTHSRLFYENWYTLKLGAPAQWAPGTMLWWLFHSRDSQLIRNFGMEILELATTLPDPSVRFALIEAIEVCGDVFFANTAPVATRLGERDGIEHRYFGQYHRERETGHLQADEGVFFRSQLTEEQTERCLHAIDRVFDNFLAVLSQLHDFGQRALADERALAHELEREYQAELQTARASDNVLAFPEQAPRRSPVDESQAPAAERLRQRLLKLRRHPLLSWLRDNTELSPRSKLQGFVALWGVDIVGYKDFNELVLRYPEPKSPLERALNQRTEELATHGALYLRDWQALELDDVLGWDAGETIAFYFLGAQTEIHRRNMARVKKLAFGHPDAITRHWLLHALESSGEPLFEATAELAKQSEREHGIRLDYWANRHQLAHRRQDTVRELANFSAQSISAQHCALLIEVVDTIFDNMEEQYTLSWQSAREQLFVKAPASLPPPRLSGFSLSSQAFSSKGDVRRPMGL